MELRGEETTRVTQSLWEEIWELVIDNGIQWSYLAVPLAHRFKAEKYHFDYLNNLIPTNRMIF